MEYIVIIMTNRITRTRIRSSRKYRKRDVRKNNGSKRRSRRSGSMKYRIMTRRKMNKMKGGAGSWDCKCRDPIDGELKEESHDISSPQLLSSATVAAAAASTAAAVSAATLTTPQLLSRRNIAETIAAQAEQRKRALELQLEQLLQQQKKLQQEGRNLEPILDDEIKRLRQLLPLPLSQSKRRPNVYSQSPPIPLNQTTILRPPIPPPPSAALSRPENVSRVLKRKMIREKDGTYTIDYRDKLPNGFKDGDTILNIDNEEASASNIDKLYDGSPGHTAVVTVINNTGGTLSNKKRTITIQYS